MQWNDEIRIETPEQIDVQLEIAGLGSRFVAQLYDWLIKWGLVVVIGLLILVVLALLGAPLDSMPSKLALAVLVVVFYFFLLGFDIYFELRHNGRTPGKKRAGIRVVRQAGGPLDFQAACVRNLLGMADFLPSAYLLGALLILLSPRGQRLGDLAAGTIVIRERAVAPPDALEDEIEGLASKDIAFSAEQLRSCVADDRHLLRSYFQRYRQLEPSARSRLAFRLTESFLQRLAYEPPTPIVDSSEAEALLASLYRDLRNWSRAGH